MSNIIKYEAVNEKIVQVKGQSVILDFEVADLYGIETKRVNERSKSVV